MAEWRRRKRSDVLIIGVCFLVYVQLCATSLPTTTPTTSSVEDGEVGEFSISPEERYVDDKINEIDSIEENTGLFIVGSVVESAVAVASERGYLDKNSTYFGDNVLWRNLVNQCGKKKTLTCVKKNVFNYLNDSVSTIGDLEITDGFVFTKNKNPIQYFENKYSRVKNEVGQEEEEEDEEDEGGTEKSLNSFEGVADNLYDKGVSFLKTHDIQFQLPKVLFGGALVTVSPRALEQDGGALLRLDLHPDPASSETRLFHHKKKKIQRKLILAFLAILLVVKLIKLKIFFLLPLLVGVGTAKKLFLKVLLFLFPAFAHLFKFCTTYHATHASKFHHHHHQVAHHHHHVPVRVPVPVPIPAHHHHHHVPVESPYPPSSHGGDWEPGPPGEYISNRNEAMSENELASWGLGPVGGNYKDTYAANYGAAANYGVTSDADSAAAQSLAYPAHAPSKDAQAPYAPQRLVQAPANRLQQQVQTLEVQQQMLHQQQQQQQLLRQQQFLQQQQQQRLQRHSQPTQPPPPRGPVVSTTPATYDSFYSPILQRMDSVFVQLGFNEEACRSRLVCSMYKDPQRFSPHSNLISAELSRDAHELQKPTSTNLAVVRFYRYIQAARDGQDRKDCIRLYPACAVNTEGQQQH